MTEEKWNKLSFAGQVSNIGSEVHRAIRWKNAGNAAVFADTERICKENTELALGIKASTMNQELILESAQMPELEYNRYEEATKVIVSKKRSYEAASAYKKDRVAVHNFASASNPGGGVTSGANAQEECLCRCSSLYFCLNTKPMWDGFYGPHRIAHDPLHNDDIIYTPDVDVFKTDTANPVLMAREDWYEVDVITCAAPNLRDQSSNAYNTGDDRTAVRIKDSELLKIHEKRLRRILDVALMKGDSTVILGAFGCGAFFNNPEVVAKAAGNVLPDYMHAFKHIEYAVYCSPRDERNYKIFERVLKPLLK